METYDYEREELPQHISHFLRQQAREKADAILEKAQMEFDFETTPEPEIPPYSFLR